MKKFLTLFMVLSLGNLLQAQLPAKVARQTAKASVKQPGSLGGISRYNGIHGAVMGTDYYLQRSLSQPQVPVTKQRSWWEQRQRDRKAYQFHQLRRARDLELHLQEQARLQRETLLAQLPKANPARQFVTDNFVALASQQLPAEAFPAVAEPGVLYRGLALPADGTAVKNILQNGLRVADVGTEANTRNVAMSGGQPGAIRALAHTPVTNLTSFPQDAVMWAGKRITNPKNLMAIVAVNGQKQAGKTVLVAQDIPARQITGLFVPLHIDNKAVWCHVNLTGDGTFLVTPYNIFPAKK